MAPLKTVIQDTEVPAGLYLHFPFCLSRCNYCSFTSYAYDSRKAGDYFSDLLCEAGLWAQHYGKDSRTGPKTFDSIYLGGGTPSIALADDWKTILECLYSRYEISPEAEITIEVNPGTFDCGKSASWRQMGINRVSLGAQSFHDSELVTMNRLHKSADIISSVKDLRSIGINNISIDLLIGYPGQTLGSVAVSLDKLMMCSPHHVSVYLFEVKDGAPIFESLLSGNIGPLDDDLSADMYEMVCGVLAENGYEQYEISNFCRDGRQSVHNMKYWTDGFYLGMGAAAHGRLESVRYSNKQSLDEYSSGLKSGLLTWETTVDLDSHTRMVEALLMGLRLNKGVDLIGLGEKYSIDAQGFVKTRLDDLNESGLFVYESAVMKLTDKGRLLSNVVFGRLL